MLDLKNMSTEDYHFRREDRATKWSRIAQHIEAHPEELNIALENLDRWEKLGRVHPGPIHDWRNRILAAQRSEEEMSKLLHFLAAPSHDSEPIKSCSPFVGLTMADIISSS